MLASTATPLLLALSLLAAPAKQPKESWSTADPATARANFMPRSALVEVDGQPKGTSPVSLDVSDEKRVFRIRVSADGFEPRERSVEAGKIAGQDFFLALRPVGCEREVDVGDAPSMALAAATLWKAGREEDALDYAMQSLRGGNTPLANRILGEIWRRRGDRDQAVRYFTMFLSIATDPPEGPEIRAWLMQDRPGDITIPVR